MRRIICFLAMLILSPSIVNAEPASEELIRELLTATEARKILDSLQSQVGTVMRDAVQKSLKGKPLSLTEQQRIEETVGKMSALLQSELSWEKLEPMYLRLYQELFSAEEIAGVVAFYQTPAGQAFIKKQPELMQRVFVETQAIQRELRPKLLKIVADNVNQTLQEGSAATKP